MGIGPPLGISKDLILTITVILILGLWRPEEDRLGAAHPLAISEELPPGYVEQIGSTRHRVLLAMQAVLNDIGRRRPQVAAPILSRTYQVLSDGMLGAAAQLYIQHHNIIPGFRC